jgi:hypothetical protein
MKDSKIVLAYKDILKLKFKKEQTLEDIMTLFYAIMKKHGIKQSTPHYDDEGKLISRTCATPEWVICKRALLEQVKGFFIVVDLINEVPKAVR